MSHDRNHPSYINPDDIVRRIENARNVFALIDEKNRVTVLYSSDHAISLISGFLHNHKDIRDRVFQELENIKASLN